MKVILFGATGMIGSGVLRECVLDPEVEQILVVGRTKLDQPDAKIRELVKTDLYDYSDCEAELAGYDACLFCLGISSAGMSESDYHRITYELTMAAASALLKQNPALVFVFISGASTDSTEQGRSMWARVKGKTENALLKMPFKAAYMLRPAIIQPVHGAVSKTKSYRVLYALMNPLFPLVKAIAPKLVTNTEVLGRAMLRIAKHGAPKVVLESADIDAIGRAA